MGEKIVVRIEADLEDLIPGYLDNRHEDVNRISNALTDNAYEEIRSIAHSFKGSGAAYGFDQISLIGEEMENAALNGEKDRIGDLNASLEGYLKQVEVVFED